MIPRIRKGQVSACYPYQATRNYLRILSGSKAECDTAADAHQPLRIQNLWKLSGDYTRRMGCLG